MGHCIKAVFLFRKEHKLSVTCHSREFPWHWGHGHINLCSSHSLVWWDFGATPQWSLFLAHIGDFVHQDTLSAARLALSTKDFASQIPGAWTYTLRFSWSFPKFTAMHQDPEGHTLSEDEPLHFIYSKLIHLSELWSCCPKLQYMWCLIRSWGFQILLQG